MADSQKIVRGLTEAIWLTKFCNEFRKGTKRGKETDREYEDWIMSEAQSHFRELPTALESDPAEEARECLYAIQVLS